MASDSSTIQDLYQCLHLKFDTVAQDTSSPFVVLADALLLDVLSHPLIDWKHNGQFLHFFYELERLFANLRKRGRVFQIVFFSNLEGLLSNNSAHQVIASIARRHLSSIAGLDAHVFDSR